MDAITSVLKDWDKEVLQDSSLVYDSKKLVNQLNNVIPVFGEYGLKYNTDALDSSSDWSLLNDNSIYVFKDLGKNAPALGNNKKGILIVVGEKSNEAQFVFTPHQMMYKTEGAWQRLLNTDDLQNIVNSYVKTSDTANWQKQKIFADNSWNLTTCPKGTDFGKFLQSSSVPVGFSIIRDDNKGYDFMTIKEGASWIYAIGMVGSTDSSQLCTYRILNNVNQGYQYYTDINGVADAVEHQDILSYRNKLKYKTITATIYSDAESISNDQLNHIKATGADLTLVTMVTVDNATDSSPTDISVTAFNDVIKRAKDVGLNVGMLKPHIGIAGQYDSFGRDKYNPDNYDTFFENWEDLMLHYADLANANGIPILSIGCEMKLCTDTKYLVKWQDIYNSIKAKYPDLLITYSMSMYEFEDPENSGQISSVVDLIGLNVYPAYAPANYDATMKVDELKGAWWHDWNGHEFMQSINGYYDSYQKPIYITETGLTPYDDGLSRLVSDYNGTNHAYNFDAQAIGYKAAFEAIALNSHIIGVAIWHASKPFSFIDENNVNNVTPSEKVLTQYFKGGKI